MTDRSGPYAVKFFTFRIESSSPKINVLHTKNLDLERDGLVVDMNHFDSGKLVLTCVYFALIKVFEISLFCNSYFAANVSDLRLCCRSAVSVGICYSQWIIGRLGSQVAEKCLATQE